ncbi:hypothetical protein [Acidovorax sp. Leaf78]|uniref:hypothetical protein n=1 Tax=Acidovorax sp. Leaf78 TaxID=1736237 RepID=UPI0012E17329|nr:hypothetical protein [Acidovorax sp. Leaf78]
MLARTVTAVRGAALFVERALHNPRIFVAANGRLEDTCAVWMFGMAAPMKRKDEAMQQSVQRGLFGVQHPSPQSRVGNRRHFGRSVGAVSGCWGRRMQWLSVSGAAHNTRYAVPCAHRRAKAREFGQKELM